MEKYFFLFSKETIFILVKFATVFGPGIWNILLTKLLVDYDWFEVLIIFSGVPILTFASACCFHNVDAHLYTDKAKRTTWRQNEANVSSVILGLCFLFGNRFADGLVFMEIPVTTQFDIVFIDFS